VSRETLGRKKGRYESAAKERKEHSKMALLAYFPKNEKEAYKITSLFVCVSTPPPITYESITEFS
jgi:hypothetical protein